VPSARTEPHLHALTPSETEFSNCHDALADLNLFKAHLGPEVNPKSGLPGYGDYYVHAGFRGQYYGKVTGFKNDGDVSAPLLTKNQSSLCTEKDMGKVVLETALFEKVRRVGGDSATTDERAAS